MSYYGDHAYVAFYIIGGNFKSPLVIFTHIPFYSKFSSYNQEENCMRKKSMLKIALIPIFSIVVMSLSACGKSPEKTVEEFKEFVEEGDSNGLFEMVDLDDDMYWTEKQAGLVIEILHDDSEFYQEQLQTMQQQANALENKGSLSNDEGLFYFNEDKELKVRKSNVKIDPESVADVKQIKVAVEDHDEIVIEDITKDDAMELGSFGPGQYSFAATAEYPYANVNNEDEFSVSGVGDLNVEVDLELEGNKININSTYPDTKLLLNDEDIDVNLSDTANEEEDSFGSSSDSNLENFGPVEEGTKLQGTVEMPWGESKSKEITVEDSESNNTYDVTPALLQDDVREEITKIINGYQKSKLEAYVSLDAKKLKHVSSSYQKDIAKDLARAKKYDRIYEGEALGTRIDYSKVSYDEGSGGRHYIKVPVELHRNYAQNDEFTDNDPEEEYKEELIILEFIEDDDKWIVDDIDYDMTSGTDYMKSDEVVETDF